MLSVTIADRNPTWQDDSSLGEEAFLRFLFLKAGEVQIRGSFSG